MAMATDTIAPVTRDLEADCALARELLERNADEVPAWLIDFLTDPNR